MPLSAAQIEKNPIPAALAARQRAAELSGTYCKPGLSNPLSTAGFRTNGIGRDFQKRDWAFLLQCDPGFDILHLA